MIDYPQDRGVDRAHVGFTPKSGHSVGQLDVGKRPKSNSDALDIAHCRTNLLSVGLDRSRPAYPRHFAQALHFSPPAGRRTFGEMSVPRSFVWMRHWIPGLRQPPGKLSRAAKRCLNSKGDEICLALMRLGPQPQLVHNHRYGRMSIQAPSRRQVAA
jgi:hypothetical protein